MRIKLVNLDNFRNHIKSQFEFSDDVTIITGKNGSGKTNILESIVLLTIAKSTRTGLESEMVNLNSNYARVVGSVESQSQKNSDVTKLEVGLQRKDESRRIFKLFKVNSSTRTSAKFIGTLKSVLFAPDDIRLVAGSPLRRREYIDRLLVQVRPDYNRNLLKYNRILKHRNKLLDSIKGQAMRDIFEAQLDIWNSQLLESGIAIQKARSEFFSYSASHLASISQDLYENGFTLSLMYKKSELSSDSLARVKNKELIYGTTQIGPHRDDYVFVLNDKNKSFELKGYGSRGQQRTGVLCVKILENQYIKEVDKVSPVLLLDDIFSELDENYRKSLEKVINNQQTIITTADINSVPASIKDRAKIIKL